LKCELQNNQEVNNELIDELEAKKSDVEALAYENEQNRKQLEQRENTIRSLFEKYIENKDFKIVHEEINLDKMLLLIEDRLKKSHTIIQTEMNKRILDKFDQLRDYYRVILIPIEIIE
jgi:hypothetical protein